MLILGKEGVGGEIVAGCDCEATLEGSRLGLPGAGEALLEVGSEV